MLIYQSGVHMKWGHRISLHILDIVSLHERKSSFINYPLYTVDYLTNLMEQRLVVTKLIFIARCV